MRFEAGAQRGVKLVLAGELVPASGQEPSYGDPQCDQGRTFWIDPIESPRGDAPSATAPSTDYSAVAVPSDLLHETLANQRGACEMPKDTMTLRVTDGGAQRETVFCSSYGRANATGFKDAKGRKYVVLAYGLGHGTGLARTPFLSVYRSERQGLIELFRVTIAWLTGPSAQFGYAPEAALKPQGGIAVALRGEADKESRCCVPSEKSQTIWIDPDP